MDLCVLNRPNAECGRVRCNVVIKSWESWEDGNRRLCLYAQTPVTIRLVRCRRIARAALRIMNDVAGTAPPSLEELETQSRQPSKLLPRPLLSLHLPYSLTSHSSTTISTNFKMFQVALALLLQLSLCMAAPITTQGTNWQGPTGGGVLGFIVLVLDIIAWGKL
jgi:hypothetical protein